jgi:hypothetical protein
MGLRIALTAELLLEMYRRQALRRAALLKRP